MEKPKGKIDPKIMTIGAIAGYPEIDAFRTGVNFCHGVS